MSSRFLFTIWKMMRCDIVDDDDDDDAVGSIILLLMSMKIKIKKRVEIPSYTFRIQKFKK